MIMDLRERTTGAADTGAGLRHLYFSTVVSADPEAWVRAEQVTPTDSPDAGEATPEERPAHIPEDEEIGEGQPRPTDEPDGGEG